MSNHILSVSQLNHLVKQTLENMVGNVWLIGEISSLSQPISGHWYFNLKDQHAQVRCAMFRTRNSSVKFPVQSGLQVLIKATVGLFEPRGDYQIIVEHMQLAGEGLLQQQFEALKLKLHTEGLFDSAHKKPLPQFVQRVGVITSATGAALQDILKVLRRRSPSIRVIIYPTLVQGKMASSDIISMLQLANLRNEVDVLIVGRGGGSLEDLWCFNEEAVARAMFASRLPIISAVGHEVDFTIADFVADMRAATPSVAAEMVSQDQREQLKQLVYKQQHLEMAFDRLYSHAQQHLQQLMLRLQHQHPNQQIQWRQQQLQQLTQKLSATIHLKIAQPKNQIQRLNQQLELSIKKQLVNARYSLDLCQQRLARSSLPYKIQVWLNTVQKIQQQLIHSIENSLKQNHYQLAQQSRRLQDLSPLTILSRGYSITFDPQNTAIRNIHQVNLGETLITRLANGSITSQVIAVNETPTKAPKKHSS